MSETAPTGVAPSAKDQNKKRIERLNEAAEKVRESEEADLVADFDKAYDEWKRGKTPREVKFRGKRFEIPRNCPAGFALFYLRHCVSPIPDEPGRFSFAIPEPLVGQFLTLMLGEELADEIERSPVDIDFVLEQMVPPILGAWGLDVANPQSFSEADGKKEPATPG